MDSICIPRTSQSPMRQLWIEWREKHLGQRTKNVFRELAKGLLYFVFYEVKMRCFVTAFIYIIHSRCLA